ncbi:hypothetical protein B0J14DRAFT_706372 [Halenospora varia]|nr:hypothetical protein B0J14DRAFT_706372 [Halenospora varia]
MGNPVFGNDTRVRRPIFTFAEKCPSFKKPPICNAQLDPSNRVATFGGFGRGQLPAQPDIAGMGVIATFAILTVFAFVISLALISMNIGDLFWPRYIQGLRNGVKQIISRGAAPAPAVPANPFGTHGFRRNSSVRAVILAIIDLQMVLTVAYGYNFALDGVCSASVYHYYIFVNVVLMSCSSSILAILVLPNYWKTPMSALFRLAATTAVFFFALDLIIKQQEGVNHLPEKWPDSDSQDSLSLLPVMCFLDTNFTVTVNNTIANIGNSVVALQLSDTEPLQLEFYFFVILAGCFGFGALGQTIFWCLRRREDKGSRHGRFRPIKKVLSFLWLASWGSSFAVTCWCLAYVVHVRNWVNDSGWLKLNLDTNTNPGSEIVGLSQLLPLWALALILVALLDHLWVVGSSEAAVAAAATPQPQPGSPPRKPLKMRGAGSGVKKPKVRPSMGQAGPPRRPKNLQNREPRLPFQPNR